jgi:hypothetical protein
LSSAELARDPKPNSQFAIHDLGVRGLPEPQFGS